MTRDEQEAKSVKYCTPNVAALSSGKFAIFGAFSNADGLPLLQIVDAGKLHAAIMAETERRTAPRVTDDDSDFG